MTDVTWRLMAACLLISELRKVKVTGIQFEDGSGYSFNFTTDVNAEWFNIKFDKRYQHKLEMLLRDLAMNHSNY